MYTLMLRRDYTGSWEAENPVLAPGEPGYEINTGSLKIGDGYTSWIDLPYFISDDPIDPSTLPAHINSELPHPVYDDGPSLVLLYENAKV
jgi:hypothetical protein